MSRAAARRLVLRRLLEQGDVANQEALVERLARAGHRVTQTTVSRDLAALGTRRVAAEGRVRYVLEAGVQQLDESLAALADLMRTFVIRIDHSANLVVIKTTPGAAHPVAAAIDTVTTRPSSTTETVLPARPIASHPPPAPRPLDALLADEILATVAGDDTVLAVTRAADGGARAARHIEDILERFP